MQPTCIMVCKMHSLCTHTLHSDTQKRVQLGHLKPKYFREFSHLILYQLSEVSALFVFALSFFFISNILQQASEQVLCTNTYNFLLILVDITNNAKLLKCLKVTQLKLVIQNSTELIEEVLKIIFYYQRFISKSWSVPVLFKSWFFKNHIHLHCYNSLNIRHQFSHI